MKNPSELESFLQNQRSHGQPEGEGRFTLSRDEAVQKLAEYQLPFEGAWIVKVMQSLVASGLRSPIAVEQTRRVTVVRCAGYLPWGLKDLENALVNPDPHELRAVNHLVAALRVVGLSEKRCFEICLAEGREGLVWDGARFHDVQRKVEPKGFVLTVTHRAPSNPTAWLYDQVEVAKRNAEVATALRDYCFTCPIPLTLDKRRVDGLQRCPEQGSSNRSFPLTLTFLDGGLEKLEWPPGTFESPRSGKILSDGGGLVGYCKTLFSRHMTPPSSELAVLLTAHARPRSENHPWTPHKVTVWKIEPAPSRCHWILDGVRIRRDRLSNSPAGISAALFLSADGLPTDLSGFSIRDSEEMRQRLRTALRLTRGPVQALSSLSETPLLSHNEKLQSGVSNAVVAASVGLGWLLSSGGMALVAVPIGLAAFVLRFAERSDQKTLIADLKKSATELAESWTSFEAMDNARSHSDPGDASPRKRKAKKSTRRKKRPRRR